MWFHGCIHVVVPLVLILTSGTLAEKINFSTGQLRLGSDTFSSVCVGHFLFQTHLATNSLSVNMLP